MTFTLVKSIHLVCVVAWFAGMFYIFRLFVYHVQNRNSEQICRVFLVMERKLLVYIMLPAAFASVVSGSFMLWLNPLLLMKHWLWLKFCFVILLLFYNAFSYWVHTQLSQKRPVLSERSCRLINEVPTLALIAISFLVFLKPELGQ